MDDSAARLLAKVAQLYYLDGLGQERIAGRLRVSRSKVSRMLSEARERRIVEIVINYPTASFLGLEKELESRFSLRESLVVNGGSLPGYDTLSAIARAAADYVSRVLKSGDVLGVAGGETLARVVQAIPASSRDAINVVQLGGAASFAGSSASVGSQETATQLARRLGRLGRLFTLAVPAVVDNERIRDAILGDTGVKQALLHLERCTVALVGIGSLEPLSCIPRSLGITDNELAELRGLGAVGEICIRFFDLEGKPCATSFEKRLVGIDLCRLRSMPLVIGVACGRHKAAAILGALRGGYLKVLVTDDATADEVLTLARPAVDQEVSKGDCHAPRPPGSPGGAVPAPPRLPGEEAPSPSGVPEGSDQHPECAHQGG